MKKKSIWIFSILGLLVVGLVCFLAPTLKIFMTMNTVTVDPQLTVFLNGGGNSLVLKSEDGKEVLMVDTKIGPGAKKLKHYVDALDPDTHVTIVNTHSHSDHTEGNALFSHAKIIAGNYTDDEWKKEPGNRLPDERVAVGTEKVFSVGSETVRVLNMGQAHTTNDLVVYFVHRQFLAVGDLVFNQFHPVLRQDSGANVAKWIGVLDTLGRTLTIQRVLPGHGPMADATILQTMHDYFTSIDSALGDPRKLAVLKRKYQGYFSFIGLAGFNKTLKYIEREKPTRK